jgi:starch synthase (maltosyl-transferring)
MKRYRTRRALDVLQHTLRQKAHENRRVRFRYNVPALWSSSKGSGKTLKVNPYEYYHSVVTTIKRAQPRRRTSATGGEWSTNAVIYNMFVRTTTAFDHNGNGKLDLPLNSDGFRETGTFLKAIAMLPFIKHLGCNTIHLLPVTAIGHDGNKGTLGSPYAIRNPYELDENLSEPALGLDVKTQFKAFVEAAHRLGLRVVVEFVFRTAAKDGDWVQEHPEWFYWIRERVPTQHSGETDESKYGSPIFTREELEQIHRDVEQCRLDDLVQPHEEYRALFTQPPALDAVDKLQGRYVGELADGTKVKVPGAFADWPPDDNQPPWGDVTYLRMYTHPDFNYIGYNTIRMYDTRLTQQQYVNRPLWDRIVGIIPYYQHQFRIDGVMIDMGHALPMALKSEMVSTARSIDHDFAFWDENFSVTQKSRAEGYNIVFGYCWVDQAYPDRMKNLVRKLAREGFPIPFFATPESHNTPRAAARHGGVLYARWAAVVNSFLPAAPFIHSGYEIAERFPINTGLDFTPEELKRYPSETLPLFSEYAYNWLSKEEFTGWIRQVLALRRRFSDIIVDPHPETFRMLEDSQLSILAFARIGRGGKKKIACVSNMNLTAEEHVSLPLESSHRHLRDLLTGHALTCREGKVDLVLGPGQGIVFEF